MAERPVNPKPTVFLSHVHTDENIANLLESIIKSSLLGGVEVFNSSNRMSIAVGDPWRDVIIERLRNSGAVLVIATPESVARPWVNFESGGAWVSGCRVIPCCAKGMASSSLPAPLSHLQAINLASADDLRSLIKHVAAIANLNEPINFDYVLAVEELKATWVSQQNTPSGTEFIAWLKKAEVRPEKFKGQVSPCPGELRFYSGPNAVTPFEEKQFDRKSVKAGDSVRLSASAPGGESLYLNNCFATGYIADLILENPKGHYIVTLKCLGHLKKYTTDIVSYDDEDRGVDYDAAFLITEAKKAAEPHD